MPTPLHYPHREGEVLRLDWVAWDGRTILTSLTAETPRREVRVVKCYPHEVDRIAELLYLDLENVTRITRASGVSTTVVRDVLRFPAPPPAPSRSRAG